ncbi:hypothetical protein DFH27DRAFT_188113 [Peziza echinospora]|nr:hypothetical protein DFH27DRAFT_188113 [Peziza echinospora]
MENQVISLPCVIDTGAQCISGGTQSAHAKSFGVWALERNAGTIVEALWELRSIFFIECLCDSTGTFQWSASLVMAVFHELSSSGENGWLLYHKKCLEILEQLASCVTNTQQGAAISTGILTKVCDVGEVYGDCLQTFLRGSAMEFEWSMVNLGKIFGEQPFIGALLTQKDVQPDQRQPQQYHRLVGAMEYRHGLDCQRILYPTGSIKLLDITTFISEFSCGQPSGAIETAMRLLFISWIRGKKGLYGVKGPSFFEEMLQGSESYRLLVVNSEIGVRFALIYMYNEVQLNQQEKEFKPSTYYKAMQLLKRYISIPTESSASCDELQLELCSKVLAPVLQNEEWVIPWLWKHRDIDEEFVMAVTNTWMLDSCKDIRNHVNSIPKSHHFLITIFEKLDHGILIAILNEMFTNIFSYDIHLSVGQTQIQEARAAKINILLWIVLQIILNSDTLCRTPSLLIAVVNSFIVSVDQEWFTLKCWQSLIQIFSRIQRTTLRAVVDEVHVVEKMILVQQILLREMEIITQLSSNKLPTDTHVGAITRHLERFTIMIHFTLFIACADKKTHALLSRDSHFNNSLAQYIKRDLHVLLVKYFEPEVVWRHAASVGAVAELIVLAKECPRTNEGVQGKINTICTKDTHTIDILGRLLKGDLEIGYTIVSIGRLAQTIQKATVKPVFYFKIMQEIRYLLLNEDSHKWCILLPLFLNTTKHLFGSLDPISRRGLVNNPWNAKMIHKLLRRVVDERIHCNAYVTPSLSGICQDGPCTYRLDSGILKLSVMFLEQSPSWKFELFAESRGIPLEDIHDYRRLSPPITISDLNFAFGRCLERKKKLAHGNIDGLKELDDASAILRIIELLPGTSDVCKSGKGKIQRAQKHYADAAAPSTADATDAPFYTIIRPVEGISCCLVPIS